MIDFSDDIIDTNFINKLMDMLEKQLGKRSEIVLHDLRDGYEHTIVDIRNGEITGRKIGGTGSNLGLEVLKGTNDSGDKYNYVTKLPDGRFLRSSSLYFKNNNGDIIGSLCINTDITETLEFEQVLKEINGCDMSETEDEIFVTDVKELLDNIIQKTQNKIGKIPEEMDREDKIEFVKELDKKGVFLITKSGEKIQNYLNISKYTLYNYLDIAKNK